MMDELRELYLASLGRRIEVLERAVDALEIGDVDARDSIHRVAHQLKGSGASYGFSEVTDRSIDVLEAPPADIVPATRALIAFLLEVTGDARRGDETILVVDDDPTIQMLLEEHLERPGREVLVASTMAEGKVLITPSTDLLILDLFLPDADGRQVLAELRKDPSTADLLVIVLSGSDSEVARAECLALGANTLVAKPFDPASFGLLVDSLLESDASTELREATVAAVAITETPDSQGPRSVLLAEDDDLVATLIVDRLSRDGFELVRCADGEAALAEARRRPPDVAIVDVKMPKIDGFEVLSRFREIPALSETAVIVLTAMGSEHDVVRGFDLGADDYVLKPFSPTELAARVQRLAISS